MLIKWIMLLLILPTMLYAVDVGGEFKVGHDLDDLAFTFIQLEITQLPVTLYGSWRTWFEVDDMAGYPFRDIYTVGIEVVWDNLFIDVSHFCNHPVVSRTWRDSTWGEVMTTVSVGVRW